MINHRSYYLDNGEYKNFLVNLDKNIYHKYIDRIGKRLKIKGGRFLDLGCGVGTVAHRISSKYPNANVFGVDVSSKFISQAKRGKGQYRIYNGKIIPFKSNYFDVVGCFTVLEHVDNPVQVINEIVRITKPGGVIIIACPNFLRVVGLTALHPRVKGFDKSIKNLILVLRKYYQSIFSPEKIRFRFMKPIVNKDFQADYDAICETNPIDVKHYLNRFGANIKYQSGLVNYHKYKMINYASLMPLLRDISGGFFVEGIKK